MILIDFGALLSVLAISNSYDYISLSVNVEIWDFYQLTLPYYGFV